MKRGVLNYSITWRENGEKRDVKTLIDNDELRVVSFGGVLCVEDCAAGEVYVVHP